MSKLLAHGVLSLVFLSSIPSTTEYVQSYEEIIPQVVEEIKDPLFERIAECESGFRLNAKNPNSSASGEFQFIKSTWEFYGRKYWGDDWINKDVFSEDNRELAWYVYTHYGTRDWEADPKSYNCWKSEIPNATHREIHR